MGNDFRLNFISTNRGYSQYSAVDAEDGEQGFFSELKEAVLDFFFEEVPADRPIGLSRLTTETFRHPGACPARPAANPFFNRSLNVRQPGNRQVYY